MSLRNKIALALLLAVSLFAAVDQLLTRSVSYERHRELDQAFARERMERVVAAFEHQLVDLDRACFEVASRVGEPDRLLDGKLVDMVLTYDEKGTVDLHRIQDPLTGEPIQLRELPNEQLTQHHPLVHDWAAQTAPRGLLVTERGALMLASLELEGSDGEPLFLAVGRFLDEAMLDAIVALCGAELELTLVQGHNLDAKHEQALARVEAAGDFVVEVVDDEAQEVWTIFDDLRARSALLVRLESPREGLGLWAGLSRHSLMTMAGLIILFPFILLQLLQWIVTGPLNRLSTQVTDIGRSSDTNRRLNLDRDDEIGLLADEFDSMLEMLDESRKEVVRNAHLAGMSEVSSGILHNTRNALNSVCVSVAMVRRQLREISCDDLRVVLQELEKHSTDLSGYLTQDDRGQHLVPFFAAIVDEREARASRAMGEMNSLGEGVEHIVDLVNSMDSYEARLGVVETLDLGATLDAACDLCVSSEGQHREFRVLRKYDDLPLVSVERHKLMQIFVNLILNALQAMEAGGSAVKVLALRAMQDEDEMVRIEIEDKGVGIRSEDLERIFASGFTTRVDGLGIGLHLASTTLTEMGGSIEARSEGLGKGATFVLRIPMKAPLNELDDETKSGTNVSHAA